MKHFIVVNPSVIPPSHNTLYCTYICRKTHLQKSNLAKTDMFQINDKTTPNLHLLFPESSVRFFRLCSLDAASVGNYFLFPARLSLF